MTPSFGMDRRDFLAALGAALAAARLPVGAAARKPLGIQLYTVRSLMAKDVEGTLAALAQIGYREVEPAGMFGKSAAEFRAILDRHGLTAPAGHLGLATLRGDALARTLDDAKTLGHEYVVCPWLDQNDRTPDGYRRVADEFNRIGAATKAAGMQFAYHNHDFEFEPLGGSGDGDGYGILLGATDPRLVQFELDLYWITHAGVKPLDYFTKYPGRFPLVHVKDSTAEGKMADVGAGYIDFKAIFARAERAGIKHYFVERDDAADPLASARASYAYLSRMKL